MQKRSGSPADTKPRAGTGFMSPQGAPRGLLHVYALWKISDKPLSGYQLMQDIESRTEGAWRPGPGAIYPILKKLSACGYVKQVKGGPEVAGRSIYEITPAGKKRVAADKKVFRSSGERWALMGRIFSEIMEPDDLTRFIHAAPTSRFLHELMQSNGERLSREDKLYLLRQYILLLEKELRWSEKALSQVESEGRAVVGGPHA
ncbi:MAG TPA: PadR family transcriptional regulator [Conexivisphaerales archaeon]|nr:PadR family transcriptional regulator [Conexivisphaerales archaeon]